MIKKLLSLTSLVFVFASAKAQNSQLVTEQTAPLTVKNMSMNNNSQVGAKATTIGTNDTLWYFYNKHYYRNNPAVGFSTFKSPYQTAGFVLNEMTSSFVNTSTVTVSGAYVLVSRQATSTSTAVPVKVYLYNVDATNKPTTKIDSGLAVVTGTAGAFAGAMFTQPRTLTTNFAIGYANGSLTTTDTIRAWMNNAYAPTSTVTPALRYGEGLSYVKFNGAYTAMLGVFGAGTDKEFVTVPIVSFSLTTMAMPTTTGPWCPFDNISIANTSTSLYENPQFNLNKFLLKWTPVTATYPSADSIYTSNFGDGSPLQYAKNPNHSYTASGSYTASMTGKYQLGADNGMKVQDLTGGVITIDLCTGIKDLNNTEFSVFPNPSNGVITVKNVAINSGIELINVLGESIHKERMSNDTKTFDFSNLPAGNYYLKLTNPEGKTSVKKVQIH